MKKVFIVANWKSNKTQSEAKNWVQQVQSSPAKPEKTQNSDKEIIICPPFTSLPFLKSYILNHNFFLKLGAQDISPFAEGSYTGEVNGKQIKEFADYVIIGHSERRKYFNENEEMINKKIEQAINNQLIPIVCISDLQQIQNAKFKMQNYNSKLKNLGREIIIAYEPLFAIGSGETDSPENADRIASMVKKELGEAFVLYGGSLTSENVNSFTKMLNIDGVLVGGASLDEREFQKIIENA